VGTGRDLWVSTAGGGSVAAGTAPSVAAEALAAGAARYVVNVCSITWGTGRAESTSSPADAHRADPAKRSFEMPLGWYPQPVYFAAIARRHMHEFGTTLEQLGQYAVTCRQHAVRTPSAVLHDRPLTMDDYLGAPYLVDPFRAPDCCLITDGACAFVMTTPERAADAPNPVVEVAGVGSAVADTGLQVLQQRAFTSTPQVYSAPPAFAMAGVRPSDVDVLAVYDPFTIVGLMQVEDMGFCEKGMGGPFALDGGLDVDGGVLPYNTHGGMLAHAYVLATDHVLELVRQLRGTADAQVDGCEIGVYGGYGPGASTLVLQRGR
jgi:acetyl-CoA acetyltransferase